MLMNQTICLIRVLLLSLPMWVLVFSLLSFAFAANSYSPVVFDSSGSADEIPISQASARMEAQAPGSSVVRVVHHQDLNKKILVALIISSALLGATLMFLFYFLIWRYRILRNSSPAIKQKSDPVKSASSKPIMHRLDSLRKGAIPVYEYQLLEAATNKFSDSNVLSRNGRGCVYRASLEEKTNVSVKRLDGGEPNIEKELETEINWLTKIRHQNIISLVGYCTHGETRFLLYEMMQNGSLESQLHGPSHGSALTWQLRMKIAVDIARGLEYLHEHCHPPVVHKDLKSSNILLDSEFNAKISDFGRAMTFGTHGKSLKLSGTMGCGASELPLEGKVTDKTDVYSFGVILLELLLGRKSAENPSAEHQSFTSWAVPKLSDRANLPNILDPAIKGTMDLKHLYQVAAVAVLCVQSEPSYRPLITDVLHSLIPLLPVELGGSLRIS
ncbi:PREDICTED: probable receptor-like protein kinase At1g80640 [Tarenaya hassleriana]|uniref:probable receptor-like protein kinase At1g80640 n=1 Tax=Tarenaya hassleriana TaxID=28532 RepID=UPI00053C9EC8|nr:PREDICTED: probable receptor-like protein kinase At1g80640 [Tarenaya hassleriana]